MKIVQTVTEVSGEGLESLLGKKVILFCLNYIYAGTLRGVNVTCVKLEDASIVYDTGGFNSNKFTTAEKLPFPHYVQTSAIESFGETDKK